MSMIFERAAGWAVPRKFREIASEVIAGLNALSRIQFSQPWKN